MTARPLERRTPTPRMAVAVGLLAMLLLATLAASARAASISPRELVPLLTRTGIGPDWTIVDVIYAPQFFFDATGIPVPEGMDPEQTLTFILSETVHDGELPLETPVAFVLLPEGQRLDPFDVRVTSDDIHHRTSRFVFERPGDWPSALAEPGEEPVLRLIVPNRDGSFSTGNTFEWTVPIVVDG